ncbi:hypothetical protein BJX65DRAFT_209575 [Aspergillus insuetus]
MDTPGLRASLSFLQKRKPAWPNPEASIGTFRGTMKGKCSYWEAVGPAQAAYENICDQIQEALDTSSEAVRCSSVINYDLYMVGRTSASAVPHIMFSCKHAESRKQAMAVVRKSEILNRCPPGMDLGHWACLPHIVNLQLLSSSFPSGLFDDPEWGTQNVSYSIRSGFDPKSSQRTVALQLVQTTSACDDTTTKKTATIGAIVEACGRKFYLAPQHFFSAPCSGSWMSLSKAEDIDDNECEFGALSDDDEAVDEDAEFMSQYSLSPPMSDIESGLDSEAESSDEELKAACSLLSPASWTAKARINDWDEPLDAACFLEHRDVIQSVDRPGISCNDFDYALIEVNPTGHGTSNLPILSRATVGEAHLHNVHVTSVTGSGHVLQGILSGKPTYIRLPSASTFQKAYAVDFEKPLMPGDSGSIVRDADTGMIYGHIIAGSVEARVAYISPAESVLTELTAMLKAQRDSHSHSKILKIWPRVDSGLTVQVPNLEIRNNAPVCPCGIIDDRLPLIPSLYRPTYTAMRHSGLRWMSLFRPGNPCHPLRSDSARQFVLVTRQRGTPSLTSVTRIFVPRNRVLHKLSAGPISSEPAGTRQVAPLCGSVYLCRDLTISNFHMASLLAVLPVDNCSAACLVFSSAADDYGREAMRSREVFSFTAAPAVCRLLVGNSNDHGCREWSEGKEFGEALDVDRALELGKMRAENFPSRTGRLLSVPFTREHDSSTLWTAFFHYAVYVGFADYFREPGTSSPTI